MIKGFLKRYVDVLDKISHTKYTGNANHTLHTL